jgi:CHAT domain-containing protein/Tfp pilus assembly protein PilF
VEAAEESLMMKKKMFWITAGTLLIIFTLTFSPLSVLAAPPTQEEDPKAKADALYEEGFSLFKMGDYQGAIDKLEAALLIYEDIGNREDEDKTLNSIGMIYLSVGQSDQALSYLQQSLAITQASDNRERESRTLSNIGLAYYSMGQHEQALDYTQQSLTIAQEIDDRAQEAECLFFIGLLKEALYDNAGALEAYEASLPIFHEIGEPLREAQTLNSMGVLYDNSGEHDQALHYYQQALKISQGIGDRAGEAVTLINIGAVYLNLGQSEQALHYYQQALPVSQEIGDRVGETKALTNIGKVYRDLGQYDQALDYYQRALPIEQEIGDREGEGITLHNIGVAYLNLKQYSLALGSLQQARAIAAEMGDREGEQRTLHDLGRAYKELAQYSQALDSFQKSLAIAQEIDDRTVQAAALDSIGGVYRELGQYPQALDYFQQALTIEQETGDRAGEGTTLNNIGLVHAGLGEYQQALDFHQQALTIAQEVGDQAEERTRLHDIGAVYLALGQYRQDLDMLQREMAIAQEIGDRAGEGLTLSGIGVVYAELGQYSRALDSFQQALAIQQEIGDRRGEGRTLSGIGQAFDGLGQYTKALDSYQQALAIEQEVSDRQAEGTTLNNIGVVYKRLAQYDLALDYYQQALAIAQEVGNRALEGTTLRNVGDLYDQQGDSAQAITYYKQAIEVTEAIQTDIRVEELKASFVAEHATRYEVLISSLWDESRFEEAFNYAERARARAFLDGLAGGSVDFRAGADTTLLEREQTLKTEISALHNQLVILRDRPQNEWDSDTIAAAQADLAQREADYAQLLTEIKIQSPEVAGLVSVDVASLADMQSLLDPNITLVEYFVMQEHTLAFIITKDSFETIAVDVNRDDLSQVINDFRDFASLEDPHPASLKQLYTWLISPLNEKLTTSTIGIIPHGVLHYLPFAALTDGMHYLSEEYTIFTLPSASALRFIQEKRKPEANTMLALGNPAIAEPGLAPLAFAQQEAETIASLFETQPLIGDSATESALHSQAGEAGIVHLAAHGQFNASNPLFSVIYLAKDDQEDGRLEVNEIYGLDLTNATDLVVLSACETQVGEISAGDEVVGMTRAFLYAGTPTVIGSLWKVDDEVTTLLMERFYQHLREGLGKAKALQRAQNEMRAQYPHPYYWAAFVLTGDPGLVVEVNVVQSLLKNNDVLWIIGTMGVFLLLTMGSIIHRRRQKGAAA